MSSSSSLQRLRRVLSIATLCVFSILFFGKALPSSMINDPAKDVYNNTVGFAKVYAVNMPHRTDKRDAMTLASSYTGIDLDFLPGVSFEEISPKAAPVKWNYEKESNGALGCWRAHMNVMQKIVAEKVGSALIIEDDTDWDTSLKNQLYSFAQGSRSILNNDADVHHSPYGEGWDFLWLGNCRMGIWDTESRFYVTENDYTVPPTTKRYGAWSTKQRPLESMQNNTRLVFQPSYGMCTYAYAVTFEGARKILSSLSVAPTSKPVDLGYRDLCSGRWQIPFICIGVYPSIFSSHRPAGPADRDSDLNAKSSTWHAEFTQDIVYSTIQNAARWVLGETDVLAQWPDEVTKPRIGLDGIRIPSGKLKTLETIDWRETVVEDQSPA